MMIHHQQLKELQQLRKRDAEAKSALSKALENLNMAINILPTGSGGARMCLGQAKAILDSLSKTDGGE